MQNGGRHKGQGQKASRSEGHQSVLGKSLRVHFYKSANKSNPDKLALTASSSPSLRSSLHVQILYNGCRALKVTEQRLAPQCANCEVERIEPLIVDLPRKRSRRRKGWVGRIQLLLLLLILERVPWGVIRE